MLLGIGNIRSELKRRPPNISLVYPIGKKHFELRENVNIQLSNGEFVVIKAGLKFDGSSSPRILWWLMPSYGDFFFASLIHDWCYQTDYNSKKIGIKAARLFADKEMLIWSNELNNKNIFKILDNYIRYWAVRWFGKKVYLR